MSIKPLLKNLKRDRAALVLVLIGGIVAAVAHFIATGTQPAAQVQSVSEASAEQIELKAPMRAAEPPKTSTKAAKPESASGTQAKAEERAAVANEFRNANDLKAFFDKYASPAYASSGPAAYYRAQALKHCMSFLNSSPEEIATALLGKDHKANPAAQERLRALMKRGEECKGLRGVHSMQEAEPLLAQAANLQDPAGLVAMLGHYDRAGMHEEAKSVVRQALMNPNGDMFDNVATYFAYRKEPWVIGGNGEVHERNVSGDAWRLAGCDLGADCGPNSRTLGALCWVEGACVSSFDEYLRHHRYSPADYQLLQQLRQAITTAIATRNWASIGLAPRETTSTEKAAAPPQ